MSKHAVRTRLLKQRNSLSPDVCLRLSRQIQQRLLALPEFVNACSVALYSSARSEVRTEALFEAGRQLGKMVLYPRTVGATLEFVSVDDPVAMPEGRYGIHEPVGGTVIPLDRIDLVILPGVAFDRQGVRLGYGKGCYDRALATCEKRPFLIGLAYDFQLVAELPREDHDIPLDIVITEENIYRFYRAASDGVAIPAC